VLPLLITTAFEQQKVLFFEEKPADYLWVVRTGEVHRLNSTIRENGLEPPAGSSGNVLTNDSCFEEKS